MVSMAEGKHRFQNFGDRRCERCVGSNSAILQREGSRGDCDKIFCLLMSQLWGGPGVSGGPWATDRGLAEVSPILGGEQRTLAPIERVSISGTLPEFYRSAWTWTNTPAKRG